MSEKLNPQEFEAIAKIRDKIERGEVGGSKDKASSNPKAIPESEKSYLSEEEANAVLKLDAARGPSEDESAKKRAGYGSVYKGSGVSALALGMRRAQLNNEKPIEEQRAGIRAEIIRWKYLLEKMDLTGKEDLIKRLRKIYKPELVAEELMLAIEKEPGNIGLKELYDLTNPYA